MRKKKASDPKVKKLVKELRARRAGGGGNATVIVPTETSGMLEMGPLDFLDREDNPARSHFVNPDSEPE